MRRLGEVLLLTVGTAAVAFLVVLAVVIVWEGMG